MIGIEDAIGLWFEPELQAWYLDLPGDGLIKFWNIYYGTAHFVVTIAVLVFAFRRPRPVPVHPHHARRDDRRWPCSVRPVLLMPPRLLGDRPSTAPASTRGPAATATASSTPSRSGAGCGRSARARWRDLQPVRGHADACTSAGRPGARCAHPDGVVGLARSVASTRRSPCSASSSPATTSGSTRSAVCRAGRRWLIGSNSPPGAIALPLVASGGPAGAGAPALTPGTAPHREPSCSERAHRSGRQPDHGGPW